MQENNKRHSEKYNHLFARSPFCSNAHDLFFIRFKKNEMFMCSESTK